MPLTEQAKAARAGRIGTSELGAIAGIDPFRSPWAVWERIVLGAEQAETERMHIGAELERTVLRMWAERHGHRVRHNTYTRVRGILASTADAFLLGERALVEVKVTSAPGLWAHLPEHVRYQAIGQSWVWQRPRVYVVALVNGATLREWVVEPTRAERRGIREMAEAFHRDHIETGEIPVPMFPHELAPYLRILQGLAPEQRRQATADEDAIAATYLDARREAGAAKAEADGLRLELLAAIRLNPRRQVIGADWAYEQQPETGRIVIHDQRSEGSESDE